MDQLLKQLASGAGGMANLAGLFGGAGGANIESQQDEEMVDDEAMMENAQQVCDIFIHNKIKSTSHTVQWLPFEEEDLEYPQFSKQYFLLGTHHEEEGADEELYVASVRVPRYEEGKKAAIDTSKLGQEHSQVEIVKSFKHEGDVSKARAMKQDWKVIASILNTGEIALYNFDQGKQISTLTGLESEGFGLCWSPHQQGLLVGATGQKVCLWDVQGPQPLNTINNAHQQVINDVKFSNLNPNMLGTVSDDSHFKLWDLRDLANFTHTFKASDDDLLVIGFSHFSEYLFATGGEQSGILHVWDTRMPKTCINDLNYHKGPVNQIEWSPHSEWLFMTSSSDGKVFIWDQSKCGEEQARHDFEDGPPELIYPHEMHRGINVEDISWSPAGRTSMCVSVDTDMHMQVWKLSEEFFFKETDLLDRLDLIKESDLE